MSMSGDDAAAPTGERQLSADMFVSVDGFAAGADGTQAAFRSFGGSELGRYIQNVLNEAQALVLGRVTYELLSSLWSGSPGPAAERMNQASKVVFSNTLAGPLGWNARLAERDLQAEIVALKGEPGDALRAIGSLTLVKAMMKLGLVDRLRLVVFPVVLGATGSQPMFDEYPPTNLQLADWAVLDGDVLALEYQLVRDVTQESR
jgi:dihydrofolate reductase